MLSIKLEFRCYFFLFTVLEGDRVRVCTRVYMNMSMCTNVQFSDH